MSISVRHVTKRFAQFTALDDVSVDIPTGSLTALLGPSGSGKSTLLRVIAGLDTADAGTVSIEGSDATHLPPQRREVGFVFQHYAPFKHMTVYDNIAFGLTVRKAGKAETKTKVTELLELVHLEKFQTRYPDQLSGGQRQRMALARAFAVAASRVAARRAVRCARCAGAQGVADVATPVARRDARDDGHRHA